MSSGLRIMTLAVLAPLASMCFAAESRSYAAGSFALAVDGAPCGFVKSVEGGGISAQVIEEPGQDPFIRKHIGAPVFEPVTVQVGFASANQPLFQWISQTLGGAAPRHNLTVTNMDYQMQATGQRLFAASQIGAIAFPECDGTAKTAGYLAVTFVPENIQQQPPVRPAGAAADPQKQWVPANFRLQIDGLNTAKVNRIAPFTISRGMLQDAIGEARVDTKNPGRLQMSNLLISVPESGSDDWSAWLRDFVIEGNNSQEKEKSGTLELLSQDMKTVLARVKFSGLGIMRLEPDKVQANADQIRKMTAELYVERVEFDFVPAGSSGSAAADAPAPAAETPAAPAADAPAAPGQELLKPNLPIRVRRK